MKTIIIDDKEYKWHQYSQDGNLVMFIGYMWINGNIYHDSSACKRLYTLFIDKKGIDNYENFIDKITGHYAIIVKFDESTFALVDKIRSYPIYYFEKKESMIISNSANKVLESSGSQQIDTNTTLVFEMSGYSSGNTTLYKNIKQLRPGEYLFVNNHSKSKTIDRYYRYYDTQSSKASSDILIEQLHEVIKTTFLKMIESLDGRPVWLPLSGGYDSRLIIALLQELKYDNIVSYTYGIKNLWEVKRAQHIAKKLSTKWYYVELNPRESRQHFLSTDRQEYYKYAGGLNSAPHLPEYLAVTSLRKNKLIPDDAIIINGQSGDFITGGHLPSILKQSGNEKIPTKELINSIINKHYSLWQDLKTKGNITNIVTEIDNILNIDVSGMISKSEFSKKYELFEFEERQSKYVVNGQRQYDYFGYEWRLPLWSDEMIHFWRKIPWETKYGQKLYLTYLDQYNFGGVFRDIKLPPQFSLFPFWSFLPRMLFKILSKTTSNDLNFYYTKYLKYYMAYSHSYPQQSYREYLKDSKYHRNPTSYAVKSYLRDLGIPFKESIK